MNLNFLTKKGFTLIELLIVVAIIAILAAIAIPNFLQAQIRAKVSNVKEGMQASATALEAYYVDNNSYPWELPGINQNGSTFSIPNSITTPVAYMTSIPTDVFDLDVAIAGGQFPLKWAVAGPTRGLVVNEADGNPNTDKIYVHREDNQTGVQYVLFSEGPGEAIALAENGSAIAGDGYFWYNNGDLYGYSEICQPYRYWYDPTNGTVSLGYVARLQGGTNSP